MQSFPCNLQLRTFKGLIYLLIPWSRVLFEKLTGLQLVKKFTAFMQPEGSSPHLQVAATCLYPEPAQPSLYPCILLPEDLP
jgi:hypothetical protein